MEQAEDDDGDGERTQDRRQADERPGLGRPRAPIGEGRPYEQNEQNEGSHLHDARRGKSEATLREQRGAVLEQELEQADHDKRKWGETASDRKCGPPQCDIA